MHSVTEGTLGGCAECYGHIGRVCIVLRKAHREGVHSVKGTLGWCA